MSNRLSLTFTPLEGRPLLGNLLGRMPVLFRMPHPLKGIAPLISEVVSPGFFPSYRRTGNFPSCGEVPTAITLEVPQRHLAPLGTTMKLTTGTLAGMEVIPNSRVVAAVALGQRGSLRKALDANATEAHTRRANLVMSARGRTHCYQRCRTLNAQVRSTVSRSARKVPRHSLPTRSSDQHARRMMCVPVCNAVGEAASRKPAP